jgi:uncharacterized protein
MLIEALEIDDAVRAKLHAKHRVIWDEVLAVCFGDTLHVRRGREGTDLLYGQTDAGRYLIVVAVPDVNEAGTWHVVTAREMTDRERAAFRDR